MNAIQRIELALYRAASQMKDRDASIFKLVAAELELLTHDSDDHQMEALIDYRKDIIR